MKKITVGPRLSVEAGKWYASNFSSRGGGAEFVLEAFPTLYKHALAGLRGKFSPGEISLLLDTFNSTMITPHFLGQSVQLCADDSMRLDRTDKKWSVTPETFLSKIRSLTHFEKSCLEIFVRAFWESGEFEKPGGLENWVAQIA